MTSDMSSYNRLYDEAKARGCGVKVFLPKGSKLPVVLVCGPGGNRIVDAYNLADQSPNDQAAFLLVKLAEHRWQWPSPRKP